MTETLDSLRDLVGPRGLRTAPDIARYLTDPRGAVIGASRCVLVPETVAEVQAILRHASAQGIGVIPQGGNTGLVAGAGSLDPDSIVLSLEKLNAIEIDPVSNTATVGAGAILANLRSAAAEAGRLFPLSLGAQGSCQIGGLVSTNAGGVSVLKYGMMRDLVLGLEVVLPDGRLLPAMSKLRKNNVGYDLKQLFIGAEGTLGVVTGAVLKLVPMPRMQAAAFVALPSVEAAVELFHALATGCAGLISAFEYISGEAVGLAGRHLGLKAPCPSPAGHFALIELDLPGSLTEAGLLEAELAGPGAEGLWDDAVIAANEAQRLAFWHIRESLPEAMWREGGSVSHDISVPIAAIPEFLDRTRAKIGSDWRTVAYGHIGDGNLHCNVFRNGRKPTEAEATALAETVYRIALDMGGSFSAEHGIGRRKLKLAGEALPAAAQDLRAEIKRLLDPKGLMNPGALFPAGR